SGTNVGAPGDIGDDRTRRKRRRHDRPLLLLTPRSSPLGAGNDLHSGHLDVSCTGASNQRLHRCGHQALTAPQALGGLPRRVTLFLDADDYLYPRAVGLVVREFAPGVAKVQYRLDLVDAAGRIVDSFPPPEVQFDEGDVVPLLLSTGRYEGTVTSGNAFSRRVLEAILPMPEERFRQGGDGYLCTLAPLFGTVRSIEERLGAYVQHGANHGDFAKKLQPRLRFRLEHDAARYEALRAKAAELGLRVHPEPGLRDAFHLENRIASLCLDAANHPMPADSRLSLALRGAWATRLSRLPV